MARGVPSAGGEPSAMGRNAIHMKMHRAESAKSGREEEEEEERACTRGGAMDFSQSVWKSESRHGTAAGGGLHQRGVPK